MDNLYHMPERSQYAVKTEYYAMKQDQEKANAVAKMNVALFPEDIAAYTLLSQMQTLRGDHAGIIESYKKILELDPTRQEILSAIGAQYETLGDYDNALRYYAQFAERFPTRPQSFIALASPQRRKGDLAQARSNYEKALLLAPGDVSVMIDVAGLNADEGRFEDALKTYEDALGAARAVEDSARALSGLSDYYERRGQMLRALDYRQRYVDISKKFQPPLVAAALQMQTANLSARAGRVAEASAILKRLAAQLQPPLDLLVPLGTANLDVELGQADEAERNLTLAEESAHKFGFRNFEAQLLLLHGRIAELRSQWQDAIDTYVRSEALAPGDALITHVSVARCYRELGQPQRSISELEPVLRAIPFQPRANYEMALAHLDAKDNAHALEYLQRALQVWSNADPAYRLSADARSRLALLTH